MAGCDTFIINFFSGTGNKISTLYYFYYLMPVPKEILELVERFKDNLEAYRSGHYKEAQLRREFLDPFFTVLGWDVENKQGAAEAYKDVIYEDTLKIGAHTKAPDYCFRVGGTRKFFVEAKKPSIDIKGEAHPAYQLRRYAWSAKLPLSILTDFEEFAVYDCRFRPHKNDTAATARVLYINYADYAKHWDEIASIFSHEAVLKGAFDKYAGSGKAKKGTAEVDSVFLKEIEKWRDLLAHNIAVRNPKLTQRELNFAVQRTIDRVIFLRICEDRGIEHYGRLMSLQNGMNTYTRLFQYFQQADDRYNSGLFYFKEEKGRREPPDRLTRSLKIDDKTIKEIIGELYYPKSPYEFSVLPADILGQVYEQFLGKVIRLTEGHRAVIEEKPEVKKAGGIYYTPTYIVDYIVKHTVGKILEGKTPKQAAKLKILDPACGSGSFLIAAYQHLLDWHLDKYVKEGPEKHKKQLYQGQRGGWRLTSAERKRILLNNIHGVDIDSQAVEVTKLSLLLKVLEGESDEVLKRQLMLFHERALPDLGGNIKCGNSLIGPDFYDNQQMSLLDEEEKYRINVFDWKAEFPEIFNRKNPGFDAVIGNPPWGAEIGQAQRIWLRAKYPGVADFESSQYFLIRTIFLLGDKGVLGMIIPNTFALNVLAGRSRQRILESTSVSVILDLSHVDVFAGPKVRSIIMVLSRSPVSTCRILRLSTGTRDVEELQSIAQIRLKTSETWRKFLIKETPLSRIVARLLKCGSVLADQCDVKQGYIPYRTSTLVRRFGQAKAHEIVKKRLWHSRKRDGPDYLKELQGADVRRYFLDWSGVWIRYGEWVSTYLPLSVFSEQRILVREITGHLPYSLLATYTERTFVHNPSVLAVLPRPGAVSLKFVLGVLNSRIMSTLFTHLAPKARKGLFPKIIITDARRLPFPPINPTSPHDQRRHDRMVEMVEQMLSLHKNLAAAKTDHEKTVLQRQIETTDCQIDHLVYELYGLTDEEIKIVEKVQPNKTI